MLIFLTILVGLSCLAVGLFIHQRSVEDLDDVYISPMEPDINDAYDNIFNHSEKAKVEEIALLDDILRDDASKESLMAFTKINQRKDKQLPLVGLPDKALFHIH